MSAIQYWHVCLISILAGAIQLLLLIVISAIKSWVVASFKYQETEYTVYIGAFAIDALGYSVEIPSSGGITTLKAMLILSILILAAGIVFQVVSTARMSNKLCLNLVFLRMSQGLYLLSDIFLMIGLIEYHKFWTNIPDAFSAVWHVSTAFVLGWVICILFLVFMLLTIVYVNFLLDIKHLISRRSAQAG